MFYDGRASATLLDYAWAGIFCVFEWKRIGWRYMKIYKGAEFGWETAMDQEPGFYQGHHISHVLKKPHWLPIRKCI